MRHARTFLENIRPPLNYVSLTKRLRAEVKRNNRCYSTSVDESEIAKFSRAASEWWNPHGEFEMLHRMNPVRVRYVRDMVARLMQGGEVQSASNPFAGMRILDIGCGGGLLSEALARLGATVVGADAGEDNIKMAQIHAIQDPALKSLEYRHITAEQLVEDKEQFDIVCALEIIEHVVNPREFTRVCSQLVKPNGLIFFSTINRTPTSYLFTILLAEHLLRWVPPGTHDHAKYITPNEMELFLTEAQCEPIDTSGISYNPITKQWKLLSGNGLGDLQMNYIVGARKLDLST
ncbi:S-adenosyl-L-methionine-dependent methyltransferase [Powellomyces hirtus]|nr:S-adenosyl-L-methionine-dependent methyltransferase [Powellomyces hirtus]